MARLSLAGAVLFLSTLASAVEYVSVSGANFINNSTGKRFEIIGVDYQPGGSSGFSSTADPLSDPTACLRDAIMMQQLGINTIRVYNLDTDLDHNECASIFNAAGIYMILDVNSGLTGQYIDRTDPASTYTLDYMQHIFGIVEAFWSFPNLLGFWAANEIINEQSSENAPMYIRAVVRDLKEYIALHAPRSIGVGYSAADVDSVLTDTWNYLGCTLENSTYSKIDFFGLNDYEWCGDSTFTTSGYSQLVEIFASTDIPVFFSEYGCNLVQPRTFTNVEALYGSEMGVMSGGLVYEYSQETDNYGLVAINSSTEITLIADYSYLQQEFLKIDMDSVTEVNSTAEDIATTTCATSLISGTAAFVEDWDLPARPSGGDSLVTSGLSSASVGSLTSLTATAMPATVYNVSGAQITGLKLVSMGCADSNYPGLAATYTAGAETCAYATSTGSASSTTSSKSAAGTMAPTLRFELSFLTAMAVVFSSFIGGIMLL